MIQKTYICFDFYCPKCKRRHIARTDPDYVCDPNRNYIECSCEKQISITSLIYLYKIKSDKDDLIEIIK